MTALLFLATLIVKGVLAGVIVGVIAFVVWVLWDCLVGGSAQLAAETRARARREVAGR